MGLLLALVMLLCGCSQTYRIGDRVLIEWEGADYPASITMVESPGRYRVHYENYDPIWDESVPATRIKGKVHGTVRRPPPPAKVRARTLSTSNAPQSLYKIGDRVRAEWKGTWYPATVISVLGDERYRIHYDGYDSNWDENVELNRIQRK